MKIQFNRRIVIWNVVLTTMLLVSVAGNALWAQAANDPPVRVFTSSNDDVGVSGSTGSEIVIDDDSSITLATVNADLSNNHSHVCTAIGSADAERTANSGGVYIFSLRLGNALLLNPAPERRVHFVTTGSNDQIYEEVSSLATYDNLSGPKLFRFTARKLNPANVDITVRKASMTVICLKNPL